MRSTEGFFALLRPQGGIHNDSGCKLLGASCQLDTAAGALIANDTDLSIFASNFINNTGYQSGAINLVGGSLAVNGSIFVNNTGPQVTAWTGQISNLSPLKSL